MRRADASKDSAPQRAVHGRNPPNSRVCVSTASAGPGVKKQYRKEEKDREAIQILRRIDAIGLKIMVAAAIAIAFASAVTFIDGIAAGYALVGTIFAFTILRFILFCAMYKKEI